MSGYYDRGASAGGHDQGYFNRDDVTGPEGVGSATGGPGGVADENFVPHGVGDNLQQDPENPNIVKAVPQTESQRLDETAGTNSPARVEGTYPDIIEGSDSERTGTSWGVLGIEDAPTVSTPRGEMPEGEGPGEAGPNRNTGNRLARDD